MEFLKQHIEAIIFCSNSPISIEDISVCMNEMFEAEIPIQDMELNLNELLDKYSADLFPFQIIKTGGGYQFLTKPAYQSSIGIYLKQKSKKRLSTSAVETLSIISYKQPITKTQIEQIRGVNCEYAIHKLLEKELIEIRGKADSVGKPVLYGTTIKFMDYFGINQLSDLPTPKDFTQNQENEIGFQEKD